ncbi:MAG: hypothetical protein EA428_08935 [Spirochaetaceae bacterium]|nr:MAG: hypothetical protein EA428_08935 [Spirochaetaceae bacterium]
MRLFTLNVEQHEAENSYLIAPDDAGDAILVDPTSFTVSMLRTVEDNRLYIRSILLTHPRELRMSGIGTILKVYDATLYATYPNIHGYPTSRVQGNDTLDLSGFQVKVVPLEEYSRHAVMFSVSSFLFCGPAISAGIVAENGTQIERMLLAEALRKQFKQLSPTTLLFPLHGPPSTVEAELTLNRDLSDPSDGDVL